MSSKARLEWIDSTKGLGIILLVVLHVLSVSRHDYAGPVVWALRLFRMPMFFIVSGLLFSAKDPITYAERRVRSLLVPYASFLVAISLASSLRHHFLEGKSGLGLHSYKSLLLGGERLTGDFGVFWFMTCLFVSQLLYNALILRWGGPTRVRVILSVLAFLLAGYVLEFIAPDFASPLAVGVAPFGMAFIWIGHLLRTLQPRTTVMWPLVATVTIVTVGLGWLGQSYHMDLKHAEAGPPILGVILAAALTWMFFQLSMLVDKVPVAGAVLRKLGEASIVVMFVHQFVHWSLRHAGVQADFVLIAAGVAVPYLLWRGLERSPLGSALFLGTAESPRFVDRLLQRRHVAKPATTADAGPFV